MQNQMKALRHIFSLLLPATALVIIPACIEDDFHLSGLWTTIPGGLLICAGLAVMGKTIWMFIRIGKGTLAPWDPTRQMVVSGLYRYVRNPMILGALTVLAGEAILFTSWPIAVWAVAFFIVNTLYFIFSEEPGLEKRFGQAYLE